MAFSRLRILFLIFSISFTMAEVTPGQTFFTLDVKHEGWILNRDTGDLLTTVNVRSFLQCLLTCMNVTGCVYVETDVAILNHNMSLDPSSTFQCSLWKFMHLNLTWFTVVPGRIAFYTGKLSSFCILL